jgi:hypothetical protein
MKAITLTLGSLLLLSPVLVVQGQVYETTDEEGNTVFTDVPPGEEAKPLNVDPTNIADSVKVRPPDPEEPPQERPAPVNTQQPESTVIIGGDDDIREEVHEERRRRELRERLPGPDGAADRPVTGQPRPAPAVRPHGRR